MSFGVFNVMERVKRRNFSKLNKTSHPKCNSDYDDLLNEFCIIVILFLYSRYTYTVVVRSIAALLRQHKS
jgi:hypothetical protein